MHSKIQILVIDEEGLLRDGVCALLNLAEDIEVLGVIVGGPAVAKLSLPTDPDVVIVEFSLPDQSGPATIAAVRSRWPRARILVLSFHREDHVIEAALRAGVDGYLLKSDTRHELFAAIRTLMEGGRYVSPSILDRVVSGFVRKRTLAKQRNADGLSDREREVMKRIALGFRTREIAQQLSLSHKTIEKHRSNLMRKLGLRSATAVAAYAIANDYLRL
jgi:DNA-binding NarL/FixJ family response regulator